MPKNNTEHPALVYLATNLTNGKRYIGVTARTIARRIGDHASGAAYRRNGHWSNNAAMARAIRKYGINMFRFSVLVCDLTIKQALEEEKRLISLFSPEYNSTTGGEGSPGHTLSDAAKARIGIANRGNKYNLGKKRSKESCERMRLRGYREKDLWAKRAHLGPEASSRRVICLDDQSVYSSASAAARAYGVAKSTLIELCLKKRGRKTVGGYHFQYAEH